jgi:Recombinase zinc beta ribbon domain
LAPQRYAGGYVLTELLRCACGSPMVGTSNRSYRYYRCKARCGRPSVRANHLDAGVMDLIRRTLVTPQAVRDMVHLLNEDIQMRAERRTPNLDEADARIRKLQHEDANLRRALRSAGPKASERIGVELEAVAAELETAQARLAELDQAEQPLRITTKLVRQTIDDMNGILDHAPLATRMAWVRDLFERIDVDSREEKAVAVWRAATDEGVNRSDSVYEWLRRAGAGRLLIARRAMPSMIALPRSERSRDWLASAIVQCDRCHRLAERTSPVQRRCPECRTVVKRTRSREAMRRRRA